MECFTSDTLLRVQLDWKCLISKKKKKSSKEIFFFFLLLKILSSGSVISRGMKEANGKLFGGRSWGFAFGSMAFFSLCAT